VKVRIVRSETIKEIESEINNFLSDRKDIKVVDIREVYSKNFYIFIILYEYMRQIDEWKRKMAIIQSISTSH